MPPPSWARGGLLASALAIAAGASLPAQSHGNPGGGPGGGGPPPGGSLSGGMPGGRGMPGDHFPGPPPPGVPDSHGPGASTLHGGLQLGPPGRWWDDRSFAKQLHLSRDQQTHMDAIFDSNRGALFSRFQALRQEELAMETLVHGADPSEAALFAQIDRIAQARAELEKANTHYLLAIRHEMTPDQIARLDEHR